MLEAILFDFDGTIAETERLGHRVAYNAAFAALGLGWDWDERLYGELLAVGGGKERLAHFIERYRPANVPAGDRADFIRRVHQRKQDVFASLIATIRIRPGVRRLIREARAAGVRLAIATTAARAGVDALIEADLDLRDAFAEIAAGDVVANKKPAPDIYLHTLARLGIGAGRAIAIEDSSIGTQAAVRAGLATLVTVSDYTHDETFGGAAAVLSDLGEADAPARVLAGPPPPAGIVDLHYLRTLISEETAPPTPR